MIHLYQDDPKPIVGLSVPYAIYLKGLAVFSLEQGFQLPFGHMQSNTLHCAAMLALARSASA